MKILVISLAGIGDTMLATPLIRELRVNFPDAQVDALVLWAGSKDLLTGNPNLNTVHQKNLLKAGTTEALKFLWPLRRSQYDISINTHPQSRIHYRGTAWLVGARTRISHVYECSGVADRFLVNKTQPQDYQKHSVENNLDLLSLLEKRPVLPGHTLEVFLSGAEEEWAERFRQTHELSQRPTLGIHVGSGGTKNLSLKRWPLEHYVELVKKLRDAMPELAILLFGGPEEEPELARIMAADKSALTIRAKTENLRQAGALMKRCTAFLSVDTALMHLAAAVKAPGQIVIEAPTFNKTNEPYGNEYVLVPNPAVGGRNLAYYRYDGQGIHGTREELQRLMASVSVDAVYEAVHGVLRG
ncbi:MAG TPA: glycosyltransferase family 9 protein [Verrucomicrobiae bacterium]|nr:glycosyltransferase family 9 protein [Verrucomicrobiae bacterium]